MITNYEELLTFKDIELKNITKKIDLKSGLKNKEIIPIVNFIIITYIRKKDKALESINREEIFKANVDSKNKFLKKLLDYILGNEDICTLLCNDICFYESKRNILMMSDEIYKSSQFIRKSLSNYGNGFIRDLLYIVDQKFYKRMELNDTSSMDVEDLAECCSYLIHLFTEINNKHQISPSTFSDIRKVEKLFSSDLINHTYLIKSFLNVEKVIDNFNYKCIKNGNTLTVESSNILFEKSRKYGYFYFDMQRTSLYIGALERYSGLLSLTETLSQIKIEALENLFEYNTYPFKRYVLKIPIIEEFESFINLDSFLKDELIELEEIRKEFFFGWDDEEILDFELSKEFKLKDLIKVHRVFKIIAFLNSKYLYNRTSSKKQEIYNSWVKAMNFNDLKKILVIAVDDKKAKVFIDLFSWSLEHKGILDLQYSPFIKHYDYYLPMNIISYSSLFRNFLFRNNVRPQNVKGIDFISIELCNVLKETFSCVEKEVEFSRNGYVGDFDVIAYVDNRLYIFENKNIIHPIGLHELRSTYKDNLLKGFAQLTKCRDAIKSNGFISYLNEKLNWDIKEDCKVITCLVFGNKMFNGYTDGVNHVRSSYELINFIESGNINIKENENIKNINLWKNDSLCGDDLFNFIEKRFFHEKILNASRSTIEEQKLGKYKLQFKSFQFDSELINKEINTLV